MSCRHRSSQSGCGSRRTLFFSGTFALLCYTASACFSWLARLVRCTGPEVGTSLEWLPTGVFVVPTNVPCMPRRRRRAARTHGWSPAPMGRGAGDRPDDSLGSGHCRHEWRFARKTSGAPVTAQFVIEDHDASPRKATILASCRFSQVGPARYREMRFHRKEIILLACRPAGSERTASRTAL